MKYFAVLLLVISVVCCLYGEEAGKGWLQFDLNKTQVGMATIYYDPMYEEHLDLIKSSFGKFLDDYNTCSAMLLKKDEIVKDINELLGEKEPDTKMQFSVLEKFAGVLKKFKTMTFYIVSAEKTKDLIRKGGTLPNITYNKQTDKCDYKFFIGMEPGEELTEHLEIALPVRSENEFEDDLSSFIKLISTFTGNMTESVAIHELAEITLIRRAKTSAPYIRWFSDGVANTLTIEILKRHVSEKAAEEYLKDLDISRYKDISKEVNLLYWISETFTIKGSSGSDFKDKISFPRYCFATYEIRWLVEKHGIECIKDIMDAYSSAKGRDGKKLLSVIKEVTGEDMTERLKGYQTFDTREEGLDKYATKARNAKSNKDTQAYIANSLRMLEMYKTPFTLDCIIRRLEISLTLFKTGREELADEAVKDFVSVLNSLKSEAAKNIAHALFMDYAIETNRPGIALSDAEETLKKMPNHTEALCIKMYTLAEEGKMLEAEKIAEKILKLSKKNSRFYIMAQKVIRLAAQNKPKVIR